MTIQELDGLFKKIIRVGFNANIPEVFLYLQSKDEADILYNEIDLFFGSQQSSLIIHKDKFSISIESLIGKGVIKTNFVEFENRSRLDRFIETVDTKETVLLGKGYIHHPSNASQIISIKNPDFILRLNGYKIV